MCGGTYKVKHVFMRARDRGEGQMEVPIFKKMNM